MTDITLLDGGMGQELIKRSSAPPTPLWSTRVMIDNPGLVQAIHADFYAAGATVATTNTYAILRDRLVKEGIEDQFGQLHACAVAEAKRAQADHGKGRIAGAMGPLGASYRPDMHPVEEEAIPLYAEVAKGLTDCDLVICETIVSVRHARSVLAGALEAGKPVWLAVSVDDEDGSKLRSGEPVADMIAIARDGASAVLANCSAPEAIPAALASLAEAGLPYGAYANGFTQITKEFLKVSPTVDNLHSRVDMTPALYAEHVMGWIQQGATIVGGCCEISPAHIREIARNLEQAGHHIV